jgi:hypothetical protein
MNIEQLTSKDRLKRYFELILEKYNIHPSDINDCVDELIKIIKYNKDIEKLESIINKNKKF